VDGVLGTHASGGRVKTTHALRLALRRLTAPLGFRVVRLRPDVYDRDGLRSVHAHAFLHDATFRRAYARGIQAAGADYGWHWRVHVAVWAASSARTLPGHFVECGVNRGFMASAIMCALDWDALGKTFYLLDTFAGLDERFVSEAEKEAGMLESNRQLLGRGFYVRGVESVRENFREWRNVRIVVGAIPETLTQVDADAVAFLHLDMNCAPPEVAAAEHFWDRLVPGALVLMDDYGYVGSHEQRIALDAFAARRGVSVLALPTGQGLIVKPR
jgi:hypothetical protein